MLLQSLKQTQASSIVATFFYFSQNKHFLKSVPAERAETDPSIHCLFKSAILHVNKNSKYHMINKTFKSITVMKKKKKFHADNFFIQ